MSENQETKISAFASMLIAHSFMSSKIAEELESAGQISLDVYDVLKTLDEQPDGKLRMSELADKILLSRSGLTRRIDRLEKLGFLVRTVCPKDRRGSYAELTEKGREAHLKAWPTLLSTMQKHFGDKMTEGEAKQLTALMKRVSGRTNSDCS